MRYDNLWSNIFIYIYHSISMYYYHFTQIPNSVVWPHTTKTACRPKALFVFCLFGKVNGFGGGLQKRGNLIPIELNASRSDGCY